MSSKLGLECKLFRNTGTYESPVWDEITNTKDVTLNLEAGEADVTTRNNNGWRATLAALKDGSVDFQMVWDTDDADFTAIRQAWFNDASIEFAILDGAAATGQGLRATMRVLNFSISQPLEEAVTVDVTIKPTYAANAPEWMGGSSSSSSSSSSSGF
jgi:predicted secreted protein